MHMHMHTFTYIIIYIIYTLHTCTHTYTHTLASPTHPHPYTHSGAWRKEEKMSGCREPGSQARYLASIFTPFFLLTYHKPWLFLIANGPATTVSFSLNPCGGEKEGERGGERRKGRQHSTLLWHTGKNPQHTCVQVSQMLSELLLFCRNYQTVSARRHISTSPPPSTNSRCFF